MEWGSPRCSHTVPWHTHRNLLGSTMPTYRTRGETCKLSPSMRLMSWQLPAMIGLSLDETPTQIQRNVTQYRTCDMRRTHFRSHHNNLHVKKISDCLKIHSTTVTIVNIERWVLTWEKSRTYRESNHRPLDLESNTLTLLDLGH